jgi:ABC-type histidine transport system ATPase subunit
MEKNTVVISVKDLRKSYKDNEVLKGVDFEQ